MGWIKKKGVLIGGAAILAFAVITTAGANAISGSDSNDLSLAEVAPAIGSRTLDEQQPETQLVEPAPAEPAEPTEVETPEVEAPVEQQTQLSAPMPIGTTPDVARNTNVDVRNQYLNTPSAQIPSEDFTAPWASNGGTQNIGLGCTAPGKCLGQFRTQCTFSHFGYDDPIVFPGQQGAAHLHMFFGNTRADHNSTGATLLDSGLSTCNGLEGNRTAYWTPAVFDNAGMVRVPDRIEVYYKSHGGADKHASINDFPDDFKMVAGSHLGGNDAQYVKWQCNTGLADARANARTYNGGTTIPQCQAGHRLQGHIFFPQCISSDWSASDPWSEAKNKLTYAVGIKWSGNCPANHTKVPLIEVFLDYDVGSNPGGTAGWFLSSDVPAGKTGGETLHADWYGGWNRDLFNRILGNCITRVAECSWDLVDNGETLTRVSHFGGRHPVAYDGPNAISAEAISQALCPGDDFAQTEDAAMCDSAGGDHSHHMN